MCVNKAVMILVCIPYLPGLMLASSVHFLAVSGKKAIMIWACMTMLHDKKMIGCFSSI